VFLSRVVSLAGDWFNLLGILALLREIGGVDPRAIGAVFIAKLLPAFLVGPAAGVVADRFDRKQILIVADLVRFLWVVLLLATPALPVPAIAPAVFTLTFMQMATAAFAEPARTACIPLLVAPSALAAANALSAVAWSVIFTLGAGIGGIVTDLFGWRFALGLDAVTYLVSAQLLSGLLLPRVEPTSGARQAASATRPRGSDWKTLTGLRDMLEGIRYVRARPRIAALMTLKSGWGIAGAISLLLTLFGEQIYPIAGRPDLGISLLYVARALGTGVGPLLSRRLTREDSSRMRRNFGWAYAWGGAWYLLFSWVSHPAAAFACVVVAHFAGSMVWVDSTILLQREVPDGFRGRVFAAEMGLATLAIAGSTWGYSELAAAGIDVRILVRALALSLLLPAVTWSLILRRCWPKRGPRSANAPQ
jgi:predicted MFS family arabinose efflux permease